MAKNLYARTAMSRMPKEQLQELIVSGTPDQQRLAGQALIAKINEAKAAGQFDDTMQAYEERTPKSLGRTYGFGQNPGSDYFRARTARRLAQQKAMRNQDAIWALGGRRYPTAMPESPPPVRREPVRVYASHGNRTQERGLPYTRVGIQQGPQKSVAPQPSVNEQRQSRFSSLRDAVLAMMGGPATQTIGAMAGTMAPQAQGFVPQAMGFFGGGQQQQPVPGQKNLANRQRMAQQRMAAERYRSANAAGNAARGLAGGLQFQNQMMAGNIAGLQNPYTVPATGPVMYTM